MCSVVCSIRLTFLRKIASLVDVLLLCFVCWGVDVLRSFTPLRFALDDKEMNSRAKRCAFRRAILASTEEREEKSCIFR